MSGEDGTEVGPDLEPLMPIATGQGDTAERSDRHSWLSRRLLVMFGIALVAGMVVSGAWVRDEMTASGSRERAAPPTTAVAPTSPVPSVPEQDGQIDWVYRGSLLLEGHDTIDARAYAAWASVHGAQGEVLPLWSGAVAGANVLLFEEGILDHGKPQAFVALYVQSAATSGLVSDAAAPPGIAALTERLDVEGVGYTLALGPPGARFTISNGHSVVSSGSGWVVWRARDNVRNATAVVTVRLCPRCTPYNAVDLTTPPHTR